MGIRGEEEQQIGVYVHIPYCLRKCPYCDFRSEAAPLIPEERYTRCLEKELSTISAREGLVGEPLSTVYFGGGTPSLFSPSSIGSIIESIKKTFPPEEEIEVTLEANPDTISLEKLEGFRAVGVNRLSIGVQALKDGLLKTLGRTHSGEKALESFALARRAGFSNVGVDLIFAIPGQTIEDWEDTLREVVALKPEHISAYGLTIEKNTPFFDEYRRRAVKGPTPEEEELEAEMFALARKLLTENGWTHYEISNYALPGFKSRHNESYWLGKTYLGVGVSSHSYVSRPEWGRRWWNERDPGLYMDVIDEKGEAVVGGETLTMEEAMTEAVLVGLRMTEGGIDGTEFREKFGVSPREVLSGWKDLAEEGLIEEAAGEGLKLTGRGLLLANEVLSRIF